jgi:MEDS: MEthanogen/methylotroph, DcmR Sensory domain
VSYHPKTDEISRLGGGALAPRLAARVGLHVEACDRCRMAMGRIGAVEQALAAADYPLMSDLAASEIGLAIAVEISHRNIVKSGIWKHARKHERSHGIARPARGFARLGHVAWAYRDNKELAIRALEYAEAGIAAGQYVELVLLGGMEERQIRQVARSRTVRQALKSGQAAIRDVANFYEHAGEVMDAQASVARRIATAQRALAAGLSGSRIIAECTPLSGNPQQRDAFAQYEHLLDRQILQQPIASFCAYNARALKRGALAELACMHPFASARATPFLFYAEHNAAFGLAGTLSGGSVPLFTTALRRAGKPRGSQIEIDARSADYICQQALGALNTHALEINMTAVLHVDRSHSASPVSQYSALTIEGSSSRLRACPASTAVLIPRGSREPC